MALQLVGQTSTHVRLTTGVNLTAIDHFAPINNLVGGIATQPSAGDFIIATILGMRYTGSITATVMHTGFSQIYTTFITASELTRSFRVQSGRKFFSSEVDADIETGIMFRLSHTTDATYIMSLVVYRGARVQGPIYLGTGFLHAQDGAGRTVTNTGTVPIDTSTTTTAGSRVLMVGATVGSTGSVNHGHTWTNSMSETRLYHRADGSVSSAFLGLNHYEFDGTNRYTPGSWGDQDPETGEAAFLSRGTIIWAEPEPPAGAFALPLGRYTGTSILTASGEIFTEQMAPIADGEVSVAGTLSVEGDLFPGQDVGWTGTVATTGTLSASGDIYHSNPPPPIAQPEGGWIRKRPTGRRRSGAKRAYIDTRSQVPKNLPAAARRVVDSAPDDYVEQARPQTLRDFLTRRADRAGLKL